MTIALMSFKNASLIKLYILHDSILIIAFRDSLEWSSTDKFFELDTSDGKISSIKISKVHR